MFLQVKLPKPELLSKNVANYNPHDYCLQHLYQLPPKPHQFTVLQRIQESLFFLKSYHCVVEMFLICAIPVSNTNTILIYIF